MALVLGLDIGSRTVKGAVFSGKPGNFRLIDFFSEEIPTIENLSDGSEPEEGEDGEELDLGTPPSLEEFIRGLLTERKLLDHAEVVTGFDTKDCIIREFSVPFLKEEQIAKTVLFEAENHFPSIELDDYVLEYVKVAEGKERSQLVVWALEQERIGERLASLKTAGVDPVSLGLDAAALFNAFALTPTFDAERTTLLVDMGATSTKILLIENGKLRKVRALRLETRVASPNRMLAEPAVVGALTGPSSSPTDDAGGGGDAGGVAVAGDMDAGASSSLFDDASIESRFREIEQALQKLDPSEGDDDVQDSPIAILSDEEYDLVREEMGDDELPTISLEDEAQPEDATDDATLGGRQTLAGAEASTGEGDGDGEADEAITGDDDLFDTAAQDGAGATRFPGQVEEAFDLGRHLERVGVEIQRTLAGLRLASPVETICLTGDLTRDGSCRRYFAEEFDVETIELDFGDSFASDLDPERHTEVGRVGAVAVGYAAKVLNKDPIGIEFRKGAYRYEHKLEKLRFSAMVTAALFFLFSMQAVFWGIQEWKEQKARIASYQAYNAQTYKNFFGKDPVPGLDPLRAAQKMKDQWAGKGGGRGALYLDAIDSLANVALVLKDTRSWFEVDQIKLNFRCALPISAGRTARPSPGQGSTRVQLKPPPDGQIDVKTNDPLMRSKIEDAFNRSSQSRFFNVQISESNRGGSEDLDVLNLKVSVKSSALDGLLRGDGTR